MHLCPRNIGKRCSRTWAVTSDNKSAGGVKVKLTEEQLKNIIKRYDTDRDGRLSKKELQEAFSSLGSRLSCWRAWRALSNADANRDGYISEQEIEGLVKYLVKHGYVE